MQVYGIIPYMICLALLAGLLIFLPKRKRTRRVATVLLILAVAGEVLVCNFHSFHLLFGDYNATEVDLTSDTVRISGVEDGTLTSRPKETVSLLLSGIGRPVGTVRLDLDLPEGTDYVNVGIDAKDVTQAASWRGTVADGQIIRGDGRSAYMVLDLSGDVSDLRIRLTAPEKSTFTVTGVTLNESVPLQFSALRLALFVLGCMAVYALSTLPSLRKTYGDPDGKRFLRSAVFIMTAVLVVGSIALTFASRYDETGGISTGFFNTSGNQITQEIVDAFEAGQVSLLDTPSEELLAMENPYDWSARRALGVTCKWDHLLFEGKYYSYYGIAPVLLLYLPYHAITGYYFPASESILLFGALGIVFLSLLFLEFAELLGKRIPTGMLLCTLLCIQLSSGVWYNFVNANFYEIAQASGFMFTCAGFFFLLRSRVIGEGRIRLRHIVLATFCLSMAVLCRPTLALYCIAAVIFLVFGYIKRRGEVQRDAPDPEIPDGRTPSMRRETVRYLLASTLCFAVIGGIQMLYNYARFGSILDFGIQYSLTINDFTRSQYHTDFAMIGFYNFILAFPHVTTEFPYVLSNFSTLSTNGYYFVANTNAVGLLWRALPSLGYLGVAPAWKTMTKQEKRQFLCLLIPTCIVIPFIIIFSIWESGYGVRYGCDFAWQCILGGAAILYLLYARVAERQTKSVIYHAFTVAAVLSLVVNGALIYDYMSREGYLAEAFLRLERVFDFWW